MTTMNGVYISKPCENFLDSSITGANLIVFSDFIRFVITCGEVELKIAAK